MIAVSKKRIKKAREYFNLTLINMLVSNILMNHRPLPPSSNNGPTDENVGILYLKVIIKFIFFKTRSNHI